MKNTLYLLLLIAVVYNVETTHILSDDFINKINSKQSLWKAGRNFDPDTPMKSIRCLWGVDQTIRHNQEDIKTIHHDVNEDAIPESFDARDNWNNCKSIGEIADQSACGSCWAVAVASAMSDRICIATEGASQPRISAINIMSCCQMCSNACQGGISSMAWEQWITRGFVTGGAYNTTNGCQSYPFPPCEHHTTGPRPACPDQYYNVPKCTNSCDPNWTQSFEESLTFGNSSYYVKKEDEQQIQTEIMKNGPVSATFYIYSDFLSYKSGIYKYTDGDWEGSHAVKIMGWGVENGVKYWLIANSWNDDWGDNGYVKFIRGENNCGIEQQVTAGLPKI